MPDRGDVGGGLAVLASMIGAALSWAAGLGVVTILISVGLGSLLTYFVGMKTQQNAWKREATLRKVDDIYGPVYFELNQEYRAISAPLDQWFLGGVDTTQVTWESIRAGYKYYLVDPPLRKELDDFFSLLREYNSNKTGLPLVVQEKLLPHLRGAFGPDVQAASYNVNAAQMNGSPVVLSGSTLEAPVLAGEHPLEYTKKQYPQMSEYHLELLLQRGGRVEPVFSAKSPDAILERRFDEVILSTIAEVKQDQRVSMVGRQREDLLSRAESLRETLRVKTEEPWKI